MANLPTKRTFTSQEQLYHLANFIYNRPKLSCTSKARYAYGKHERDRMWSELAKELNNINGSVKTVEQWRTVWKDLKRRSRVSVRDKQTAKKRNGYSALLLNPIAELEKRVIAITHRDYLNLNRESPQQDCNHGSEIFCFETKSLSITTSSERIPAKRTFATQEQLSHLIDFMHDKPKFSCNSNARYSLPTNERERLWSQLANELNNIDGGVKTVEQWKVVWASLKRRCKAKERAEHDKKAGKQDIPLSQDPITELEKRVLAIIHRDNNSCICLLQSIQTHRGDHKHDEEDYFFTEMPSSNFTQLKQQIAENHIDALKTLIQSNEAYAEVESKQDDVLRVLADCCAGNIKVMENMSESIKLVTQSLEATADILKNLQNAVDRMSALKNYKAIKTTN